LIFTTSQKNIIFLEESNPTDCLYLSLPNNFYISDEHLMREFSPYGAISVRTFPEKPFAFVNFANVKDCQIAKEELSGRLFGCGNSLKLSFRKGKPQSLPPIRAALEKRRYRSPSPISRYNSRSLSPERSFHRSHSNQNNDSFKEDELNKEKEYIYEKERRQNDDTNVKQTNEIPQLSYPDHLENFKINIETNDQQREIKTDLNELSFPPCSPISPPSSPSPSLVWEGSIRKSDTQVCRAKAYSFGGPQLKEICPGGLPEILNVKSRAPLESLSSYISPRQSTMLYFSPENDIEKRSFLGFVTYLRNKNRAGIAAGDNCNVYFIPNSNELELPKDSILGVVVISKKFQSIPQTN